MNFAVIKKQSTDTAITNTNTENSLVSTSSPPPSLNYSIEGSNPANRTKPFSTNTAQTGHCNIERPKPPPRTTKSVKTINAAIATTTQALMIKSIENSSSHAKGDEKDEDDDEEEEEKEICYESNRRDSIAEYTAIGEANILDAIQERSTETKCHNASLQTTELETEATNSAAFSETSCSDSASAAVVTASTYNEKFSGINLSTSVEEQTSVLSKPDSFNENIIKAAPSDTIQQKSSEIGNCEEGDFESTVAPTSDSPPPPFNTHIFSEISLSQTSLGRNNLSKTPSFSKIPISLQNSLGTINGNRADEDTISKSSDTSGELVRGSISQDSTTVDKPKNATRLSERAKKKSWYNVLYPNYKSRADDFKRLFKEVPTDERLIVDYSCALQRDILVQGRLYVSQNYVCFHANIFRWETFLTIRWKDVTAITKEKTALVIPNAISICTAKEKYFLATFATRDKAFLMLFRVWQNTLMNKQMPSQEIWQWVHNCYGDELGLTTDDEDYIDPTGATIENECDFDFASALEDTNSIHSTEIGTDYNSAISTNIGNNSNRSSSSTSTSSGGGDKPKTKSHLFGSIKSNLNSSTSTSASGSDNKTSDINSSERNPKGIMNVKELTLTSVKADEELGKSKVSNTTNESGSGGLSGGGKEAKCMTGKMHSHDAKRKVAKSSRVRDEAASNNQANLPTDASGSSDSEENKVPFVATAECTSAHEGRQLVHTILPINVDTIFNMLFSKSKFLTDFHAMRKTENMSFGEWATNEEGTKTRTVNLTVQLVASVGPKVSKVTETQEMRECSKPGELYSIDVNSVNAGIPYADSFSVLMHYCFVRTVDDHTMLSVHAQIKYKKSIWGVVKGFIEKNTWAGLEEFFGAMQQSLQSEICIPPAKAKGRRPRRGTAAQVRTMEEVPETQTKTEPILVALATPMRHPPHLPVTAAQKSTVGGDPQNKYKWLSMCVIVLLCFLIVLNVILLLKLWTLEERIDDDISNRASMPNLASLKELPSSHEEWIELLRQQEILHETELKKWHKVLQGAIELLKKVSVVCELIYKNDKLTQQIEQIHVEL